MDYKALEQKWRGSMAPTPADEPDLRDAEIARLREAVTLARREIVTLTEAGCNRLRDYGCEVDLAERTYQPILDRIAAVTDAKRD